MQIKIVKFSSKTLQVFIYVFIESSNSCIKTDYQTYCSIVASRSPVFYQCRRGNLSLKNVKSRLLDLTFNTIKS